MAVTDIYFTKYQEKTLNTCKIDGSGSTKIYTASSAPFDLATDLVNGYLYWADSANIHRVDITGDNPTTILNYSPINGGLTRHSSGLLYPGCERYLYRCNDDGSGNGPLIDRGSTLLQIGHLSVDETNDKVYWQERYAAAGEWLRIYRSDLDGSNSEMLWTNDPGGVPNLGGISVDPTGEKVYWVNRVSSLILRSGLDGSNPETIIDLSGEGANIPLAVAVDSSGEKVYYTISVGGTASICKANLDGSNIETVITLTGELYCVGLYLPEKPAVTRTQYDPTVYVKGAGRSFLFRTNLSGGYGEGLGW